ncbi:MAG: ORF6C domain-containing protein [Clostridium sp.]|uniref:ORF6C domain-containing protein n=1 Tax=Clostridium sp. TaxID=1506 RepID=UPI003D6CC5D7
MENKLINLDECTSDELQVLQERIMTKRLGAIENQVKEIADSQCKISMKVEKLTNEMTIDYSQQEELRALANKVAVEALEYGSPAYKELSKKVKKHLVQYGKNIRE